MYQYQVLINYVDKSTMMSLFAYAVCLFEPDSDCCQECKAPGEYTPSVHVLAEHDLSVMGCTQLSINRSHTCGHTNWYRNMDVHYQ